MKKSDVIKNIAELQEQIENMDLTATNVTMSDGSTVEDTVTQNKTSILSHGSRLDNMEAELNGARLDLINTNNSIVNKLV